MLLIIIIKNVYLKDKDGLYSLNVSVSDTSVVTGTRTEERGVEIIRVGG